MATPGEDFHGAGLWSTTGHKPPSPRPSAYLTEAADRSSVAPILNPTPVSPTARVQAKSTTRCTCQCKCCGYDCCARCCCPCTCCRCFYWLCVTIVFIVLAIGIVVLVLWKVLHPKFPTYNVDNVEFDCSITGVNSPNGPSSYVLHAQTVFDMQLGNPNTKIGIYYDQIKLNVKLFGLVIGNDIIPAFYDGVNVMKSIHVNMTSGPVTLNAANQAALVTAESAGNVPLNLKIDVKVRVKIGSIATPQLKVELNCVATVDPKISSGSQVTDMKCKFKFIL